MFLSVSSPSVSKREQKGKNRWKQRFVQQLYVHLLTVLVITLGLAHPAEAAEKRNFLSKPLCDLMKVGCAKKISKARATTKRATHKKIITAAKPKSKSKAISRVVSDQTISPPFPKSVPKAQLVPKPQPKPTILQGDQFTGYHGRNTARAARSENWLKIEIVVQSRRPPMTRYTAEPNSLR